MLKIPSVQMFYSHQISLSHGKPVTQIYAFLVLPYVCYFLPQWSGIKSQSELHPEKDDHSGRNNKGKNTRYRSDLSCTWETNSNQWLQLHTIYYNMICLAQEVSKTDPWQ